MNGRSLMSWAIAGIVLIATGCGADTREVETADVSGTVTLDGQPVEGVTVYFVGEGHTGTGVTKPDGTYQLMTGGQVGENLVYFRPVTQAGASLEEGLDDFQMQMESEEGGGGGANTAGPQIPKQFTSAAETTLKYQVPDAGTTGADFKLTSQ